MSEQLTRYVPEAPGRETRDIVCQCASCQEPIYAGQYVHQCDFCGRGNTCYCVEELPVLNGMKCCAECVKAWEEYDIPAQCDCGAVGIRGEMVKRKDGTFACVTCVVFAKWAVGALALESLGTLQGEVRCRN